MGAARDKGVWYDDFSSFDVMPSSQELFYLIKYVHGVRITWHVVSECTGYAHESVVFGPWLVTKFAGLLVDFDSASHVHPSVLLHVPTRQWPFF